MRSRWLAFVTGVLHAGSPGAGAVPPPTSSLGGRGQGQRRWKSPREYEAQGCLDWKPWQRSRGQPPSPALTGVQDGRVTPGLMLDGMQDQVHQPAVDHFPVRRAPEPVKPCQDTQLQGYAGPKAPLSAIFGAWHHKSSESSMRAAAKKRSAELRKLLLFKVVRLLAPQGSKHCFQLCQGGVPLPPERELAVMTKHFEQQFASNIESLAEPETWECIDPVTVTVAEVQWHLDKLPARPPRREQSGVCVLI